jgi:hypothetical protein
MILGISTLAALYFFLLAMVRAGSRESPKPPGFIQRKGDC